MAAEAVQVQRRLITVDEYEQMVQAGIFREDDRLELIEGDIVEMSPIGAVHMHVVNRLNRLLVQRLERRAVVSVQNPIRLARSEPQPDLAVLRPEVEQRATVVPQASDVWLIIEVADTTAAYDRGAKLALYARSGIPEVWLIDLSEQAVEVYRGPAPGRYKEVRTLSRGDAVSPGAFPNIGLDVAEILGSV